jgi:ribose transport system substrate-binding protein
VAKSQSNPVFQAARTGAEDAAAELSKKLGVKITVLWRTPDEDDAQQQVDYIEQLVLQGVDGISVSCSEAGTLTPAIDKAVGQGVAVMCFDSDAPASKRFCYYGTDDIECGHTIMRELAAVLGPGKHVVAIPGGNQNARNIQNRIKGALDEATNYPDISIRGVYYSKEVPQDAAAKIEEVQTANPDIDGWAMVGSWSLFTDALLKWEPGKVKIVAMDALPAELPYNLSLGRALSGVAGRTKSSSGKIPCKRDGLFGTAARSPRTTSRNMNKIGRNGCANKNPVHSYCYFKCSLAWCLTSKNLPSMTDPVCG